MRVTFAILLWVWAGCTTTSLPRTYGSGELVIDGQPWATASVLYALPILGDHSIDPPITGYAGWQIVFSQQAPGSRCVDPALPGHGLDVFNDNAVASSTHLSVAPGDYPVTASFSPFTVPSASGAWLDASLGTFTSGTVTITGGDDEHLDGTFTAAGTTAAGDSVQVDGSFAANRCFE